MAEVFCVVSVEDDDDLFNLIKVSLQTLPIQLYHARTGREAIDLIAQTAAEIVILDIALPDIHGWDVLKALATMNVKPKGIVVLTAHAEPVHRVIAHLQDVSVFMRKPFVPAELRDNVGRLLEA